ncbi:MAG: hypothetical protein WCI53_02045 [Bacteroidota bacterium]|jgi:hypothetical protein
MNNKPNIPGYLLWEYDLETFNYQKSYKIVIDRVLLRGTIEDWTEMLRFYSIEKILETIDWTKQIDKREKDFAKLFIQSDLLNAE